MNETHNQNDQVSPDDLRKRKKVIWVLAVICFVLIVADLFYHTHIILDFENWFGFYGFFGALSALVLVLVATQLRKFIGRDEDYYDR